jgi:glycosyltransferase involved in cell wall biosynthesis
MSDVLILTNRQPYFYLKFIQEIFGGLESEHSVRHVERENSVPVTTLLFFRTLLAERPAVAVVVGSGFASVFAVALGRLLPGTTVVFYHQDFTHQLLRDFDDAPMWRQELERVQEGVPLRLADVIGTMTPFHEQYLREKGIEAPFLRIPQGAYLDTFRPERGHDIRENLGIDADELAVCVMGSFNYAEKLDVIYGWTLLEAIAELDEDTPIVGVLIGGGDDTDYLKERIRELGIQDRVVMTGHVDHREIPDYLGAMDIAMLVKPDHPADKMTTTMKLPEYLAAGNYMIVDNNAHASEILDPECSSVLPYQGLKDESFPHRVAEELRELVADPDRVEDGQRHSRNLATERFDYEDHRERIAIELRRYIR